MLSQLNLGGPEAEIMPIDSFYLRMSSFSTRDVPQGWQRQIYLPVLVVSSFQHSECSAKCPGPSSHIFLPKTQRLYANKFISKKGHNQDATNLMVDNLGSCQNISNCLCSKNKSHLSTGHSHNSKTEVCLTVNVCIDCRFPDPNKAKQSYYINGVYILVKLVLGIEVFGKVRTKSMGMGEIT